MAVLYGAWPYGTFRGPLREDGPAARITLDRPEKRNALCLELMQELIGRSSRPARATRGRS